MSQNKNKVIKHVSSSRIKTACLWVFVFVSKPVSKKLEIVLREVKLYNCSYLYNSDLWFKFCFVKICSSKVWVPFNLSFFSPLSLLFSQTTFQREVYLVGFNFKIRIIKIVLFQWVFHISINFNKTSIYLY